MEKYVLVDWPESQIFIGNSKCYLTASLDHNEQQLDAACFVPEELYIEFKSQNKSQLEIETMFEQYNHLDKLLRESMRNYLSRELMNTSEENPRIETICLTNREGFGLSSLNYPWIYKMWQHPSEGTIYFAYDSDCNNILEFDEMLTEDLVTICNTINEF